MKGVLSHPACFPGFPAAVHGNDEAMFPNSAVLGSMGIVLGFRRRDEIQQGGEGANEHVGMDFLQVIPFGGCSSSSTSSVCFSL